MENILTSEHEKLMSLALELGRRGEGMTRPNPPVGAVVVRAGRPVGRGSHLRAGTPHAEITALNDAGAKARGASLYVTLEPCSTVGRTPPCTTAIINSGIKTVVVAIRDPNPLHRGRGLTILRRAGINTAEGICRNEAEELIRPFAKWITTGRPYITLKMAESLDGKIADYQRHSRWITGPESLAEVHALRRRADAIMVGAATVCADDPRLLPRPAYGRQPWRIILDGRDTIPITSQIFKDNAAGVIIATTKACPAKRVDAWEQRGAQVWRLPVVRGRVSLPALALRLGRAGLLHVLCEGGGELAAELIRTRLTDEIVMFIAPRIIGGKTSPGSVGGAGWLLKNAPKLNFIECRRTGRDIMIRAMPPTPPEKSS